MKKTPFSVHTQIDAIEDHFKHNEMKTDNVEVLGSDGENANTGWRIRFILHNVELHN